MSMWTREIRIVYPGQDAIIDAFVIAGWPPREPNIMGIKTAIKPGLWIQASSSNSMGIKLRSRLNELGKQIELENQPPSDNPCFTILVGGHPR